MKTIKMSQVSKLQRLLLRIFEHEDDDSPNLSGVAACNRRIKRILDEITTDPKERNVILNTIERLQWDTSDYTYKTICDGLRGKGYTVIEGE